MSRDYFFLFACEAGFRLNAGRHELFTFSRDTSTRIQEQYLKRVLAGPPASLPGFLAGVAPLSKPPTEIIFAITSANQENSRFNPIPFHLCAVGVDRFARQLQADVQFRYRIFGIPHYGHTRNFAAFTIKEIALQSEQAIQLTPENCLVLCSTPEVIKLYQELGFSIVPAEMAETKSHPPTPIEIIREIGARGAEWHSGPLVAANWALSHSGLFDDFREVPQRIARLYQDPLTNQEGSLTATRNYSSYARGMNEIIRLKYLDIRDGIKPGRIVDEGCADGACWLKSAAISRTRICSALICRPNSPAAFTNASARVNLAAPMSIFSTETCSTASSSQTPLTRRSATAPFTKSGATARARNLCEPIWRRNFANCAPEAGCSFAMWWDRMMATGLSCFGAPTGMAMISRPKCLRNIVVEKPSGYRGLSTRSRFRLFARDFLPGISPFSFTEMAQDGQIVFRITLAPGRGILVEERLCATFGFLK